MNAYVIVKIAHILGATLLFGTGLGTAFFMFRAWRSRDAAVLHATSRSVVLADAIFTAPSVVLQLATGAWLVRYLGIPPGSAWLAAVLSLYALVGACWLPVVWLQVRVRDLAAAGALHDCDRLMRWWVALGIPAFAAVLVLFWLMVAKPGVWA
ncbi:MAG TPA: DUF2269 domain-containing protein [Woeseiaceae bacterium]|nr:DUF2269 domain-containing protein [Woeseiaceae bacterium]